jgi:hypothetical protein
MPKGPPMKLAFAPRDEVPAFAGETRQAKILLIGMQVHGAPRVAAMCTSKSSDPGIELKDKSA